MYDASNDSWHEDNLLSVETVQITTQGLTVEIDESIDNNSLKICTILATSSYSHSITDSTTDLSMILYKHQRS